MKKTLLKFFAFLGKAFLVGLITLCLLEGIYRFYWFDFYAPELKGLNDPIDLKKEDQRPTILVGGDSFTADPLAYVSHLRDSLEAYRVINAGVPGTGIVQHKLFLPKRIRNYQPDIFIYQIYLGNDLLDIRHPWNGELSFIRNMYWKITDHFRFLSFLNFRFAGLRYQYFNDTNAQYHPKETETFSAEAYSPRQKLYFKAEPDLVKNTIEISGQREKDFQKLEKKLERIIKMLPNQCAVYILVIPHCMQVNDRYAKRMQSIGGEDFENSGISSPFVEQLSNRFHGSEVQVLDALPLLKASDQVSHPMYYANDPHLNAQGHQVLGLWLLEQLNTSGNSK